MTVLEDASADNTIAWSHTPAISPGKDTRRANPSPVVRADECERSVREAVASGMTMPPPDVFSNNSSNRSANILRSTPA